MANNDDWAHRASEYFGSTVTKILLGQSLNGWEMQVKNALMAELGPIPESPNHFIKRKMADDQS